MRQVVTFTAINVRDLIELKRAAGQFLRALAELPVNEEDVLVTFFTGRGELSVSLPDGCGGSSQVVLLAEPGGVSAVEWVRLVGLEIENHVLASGRFASTEWRPDDVGKELFVYMQLRRPQK